MDELAFLFPEERWGQSSAPQSYFIFPAIITLNMHFFKILLCLYHEEHSNGIIEMSLEISLWFGISGVLTASNVKSLCFYFLCEHMGFIWSAWGTLQKQVNPCKCTHVHPYVGKCVKPEKVLKAKHTRSPLPIKIGRRLTILLNQAGWHECVRDALQMITYMNHFKVMHNLTVFSMTGSIET